MSKFNENQINSPEELGEHTEAEIEYDVEKLEAKAVGETSGYSTLSRLAEYIQEIRKYRFLTKEEQDEIWENRTQDNIERIVNSHLRLVIDIVNDYMPYNYRNESNFMDLIQAGNLGLIHAAQVFDPNRNAKFITHAHYWIRSYVRNELDNIRCGAIRKPGHILAAFSTIAKVEERLEQILGRAPTDRDIKVALDGVFPEDKISDLLQMKSSSTLSLDMQYFQDEEEGTLMNCIGDNSMEERIEADIRQQAVDQGINEALDPKLSLIIKAHFGLGEFKDDPKTLDEIAQLLKDSGLNPTVVSKERVRQLENKALDLLRKNPTILALVS